MAMLGRTEVNDFWDLKEFKLIDASISHSLTFIKENDLTSFEDVIEQYFEHSDSKGYSIELIPGGTA